MILRYLFYAFLIYLAYRFIVGLVIPVARTTKQVKKQFDEAKQRMQEQMQDNVNPSAHMHQPKPKPSASKGDYLEFEEVKD